MFLSETKFQQTSGVIEYGWIRLSRISFRFSDNQPGLLQKAACSDKPALVTVRQRFPTFAAAAPYISAANRRNCCRCDSHRFFTLNFVLCTLTQTGL